MKKLSITWMGILLVTWVGCGTDKNDYFLTEAEACMETRADSARWLLQQVDSALTEKQQAQYALLWTQAMHKCHIDLGNDSLINVAVEYYTESDDRHRLAKSWLYKGLVHKQHGQVERATEAFVASEQAFEGVEDNQYKALLFNHYAALLANQSLYKEALEYYKKSLRHKLLGDSVHYVVSACGQIARMYKMLHEMDSAEVYYKRGLHYADSTMRKAYKYDLLQNYAAFLVSEKKFTEAELLLKKNESDISDTSHIYHVYASLTTLYYETGDYEKARMYGERLLGSNDSLMQCAGFLHLYRIYRQLGKMNVAVHYHDLYRQYDSDITLRRKTAEVAAIPHRMKSVQLMAENRRAHHWQWGWAIGLAAAVAIATAVIRRLRQIHERQMKVKDTLLGEKERKLTEKDMLVQEIEQKLYDLRIEIGRLKGCMTSQSRVVENLKSDRKKDKATYDESVKKLKKSLTEMTEEQKTEREATQERFQELSKRLDLSEKEQSRCTDKVKSLSDQMEQYECLQRFLLQSGNVRPVLLILELKSGQRNRHITIHHDEYAELLKQLAEYVHPGIRQLIETDSVLKEKQVLACLVSLGYQHDLEMLCMATNLKVNSVKTYCTQVNAALKKVLDKTDNGNQEKESLSPTLP